MKKLGKDPLKILVVGDINADLSFFLAKLPSADDDIIAQSLHWSSGGAGLNSAVAYTHLGAATWLLGRVGRDPAAHVALQAADHAGVRLNLIQSDPTAPTGLCGVLVQTKGQRSMLSYRGANVACEPTALTPSLLADCALLSIAGHALLEAPQQTTALRAIELAELYAIPVVLDLCMPTIRAAGPLLLDLLPQLWLLTMNEEELRALLPGMNFQRALEQLVERGAYHLAIKRGAQGCTVLEGEQRFDVVPPAAHVVDTTGCGDAFTAAYAWALLHDAPLPDRAALANHLGAITATRHGGASAIPNRTELLNGLDARLHYLVAWR